LSRDRLWGFRGDLARCCWLACCCCSIALAIPRHVMLHIASFPSLLFFALGFRLARLLTQHVYTLFKMHGSRSQVLCVLSLSGNWEFRFQNFLRLNWERIETFRFKLLSFRFKIVKTTNTSHTRPLAVTSIRPNSPNYT
jgi:hypothetical protein